MNQEVDLENDSFTNVSEEEASNLSSNNDSMVMPQQSDKQGAKPKHAEKQNTAYCQLCFIEFGYLKNKKHHCRECGRSCCLKCSLMTGGSSERPYRICELCSVKQDNPQIEQFYKLENEMRQKDQWTIEKKLEWYNKVKEDHNEEILKIGEQITVSEAVFAKNIKLLKHKIDSLDQEQVRIQEYKSSLEKNIHDNQFECRTLDMERQDMINYRTQKELEYYKISNKIEVKQKEIDNEVKRQQKHREKQQEENERRKEEESKVRQKKQQEYYILEDAPFNVIETGDAKKKKK